MYIGQIEASTSPPAITRAINTLVVPKEKEFDNQSLHGGAKFWSPCTVVLFRNSLLPRPENGSFLFPPGFWHILRAGQEGVTEQDYMHGGWGIWTEPSIWFHFGRFGSFVLLFWVLVHATRFHFSSVVFIQQIVKQSTLWKASRIISQQSEYCGKKILKKKKTSHFIYRFDMNRLHALDKSNSLD